MLVALLQKIHVLVKLDMKETHATQVRVCKGRYLYHICSRKCTCGCSTCLKAFTSIAGAASNTSLGIKLQGI